MSDSSTIALLKVADEAFLVSIMIGRCPRTMMIRELVVNRLEAAGAGERQIVISSRLHEMARKLYIRNTKLGQNSVELLQITDLASSLRKQNRLNQNFCIGVKGASLPRQPAPILRIRDADEVGCSNGSVGPQASFVNMMEQ